MTDLIDRLRNPLHGTEGRAEAANEIARLRESDAALARVWKALGISTYEEAGGKYIDEIVADLRKALTKVHAIAQDGTRNTAAWNEVLEISDPKRRG